VSNIVSNKIMRSFGRRKGRKLSSQNLTVLATTLPKWTINVTEVGDDLRSFCGGYNDKLWVEIGFGYGEHLIALAKDNPEVAILGCEPYVNGVAKLLGSVVANELNNVRIWQNDVWLLVPNIPKNFCERFYILFPDPWPKRKQNKRRLLARENVLLLLNKLRKGGEVIMATDHLAYAEYINTQLANIDGTKLLTKTEVGDLLGDKYKLTRYYQKASNPITLLGIRKEACI
jgi:tRNA (guanine-N7-)-methyltransferase